MSERRYDPVSGEWRTFATHRQDRTFLPPADHCPLCPTPAEHAGTERETEIPRPSFDIVVFDNKFPSLVPNPAPPETRGTTLTPVRPGVGAAEVVVWSDDHRTTLAGLPVQHLCRLIDVWADRYAELGNRPEIDYVFIFENKGEEIGVTLHHPHGQIYGYPDIPPRPRRELEMAELHHREFETCVFCDLGAQEQSDGVRVVTENLNFVAFVPFAARFPYEVQIQPKRHAASLLDLTDPERGALADVLHRVLAGYDRLFGFSLPYVLAMHQAPTGDGRWQHLSHFHIEITPPHRTAEKLKYLAGSELAAGAFINDTTPEQTAARLREVVES